MYAYNILGDIHSHFPLLLIFNNPLSSINATSLCMSCILANGTFSTYEGSYVIFHIKGHGRWKLLYFSCLLLVS